VGKANRLRRKSKEKDRKARRREQDERVAGQARQSPYGWIPEPPRLSDAEVVENDVYCAADDVFHDKAEDLQWHVDRLVADHEQRLVDRTLTRALEQAVAAAWRHGWQPADLVRVATREYGRRTARLTTDAIAAELRAYSATTIDDSWYRQLATLDARVWWTDDLGYLREWTSREGVGRAAAVLCAVQVLSLLRGLPRIQLLCAPPGKARRTARTQVSQDDQKMLDKIRALLAKAESTEFPEEAEALTARAQQLMARYSIDHALLAAETGTTEEPGGRRLPIDNPYESPKAVLLGTLAQANRCRAIWSKDLGFSTVMGFPADLDGVELLFTSLLVQATTALVHEGRKYGPGGRSRTRSFRQSFLGAYAVRIGERLRSVTDEAEREAAAASPGTDLLPVLAARTEAVEEAVQTMFSGLAKFQMSGITDREGWLSGRAAADRADLNARPEVE
jgi:hypothetical protein